MAFSGQRHAGAAGSSSRQGNGLKGQASSVEFLGRGMVGMQLRDAKPDADDGRDIEPDVVADLGSEAGQIIATTIRGRNGLPKQSVSYIAEHVVGTGSFGVVFQAKCRETGEVVAIKKVLQDKRYKNRELQIMHMLDHPNIVGLKHYFLSTTERDELYLNLVLEFIPETVNRVARQYNRMNQRVPLIYVKLYTYQICRALAYIHNCVGICHRDIKPQNVLVKRDCWFKGNPYFNMISSNSTKSGATHVLSWCGATRGSRTLCHTVADDHADVGESITVDNGSNDLSRSFSMSSSDDTNSNIMFSTPGSKKAKVLIDSDGGMVTSLSKIESQFGMSTTYLDMPGMDDYLQLQQDFIACTVRTKHGCATHPRSIAERVDVVVRSLQKASVLLLGSRM